MSLALAMVLAVAPAAPAAPRMGQAVLSRTMPVYPGATSAPVPVGETLQANGVPMNVQSFMTSDPPRKVLDFYEAAFKKWNLPMLGNGQIKAVHFPYPSITVFDALNEVELSVIAIPSPDHTTMVLLARADMRPIRQGLERAEVGHYGGLPEYPGGQHPAAVMFTDGEVQRVQVTFDTSDPPEKVLAYYQKAFIDVGGRGGVGSGGDLEYQLPDGAWRLSAVLDTPTHRTVVSALHTKAGPAAEAKAEEAR